LAEEEKEKVVGVDQRLGLWRRWREREERMRVENEETSPIFVSASEE